MVAIAVIVQSGVVQKVISDGGDVDCIVLDLDAVIGGVCPYCDDSTIGHRCVACGVTWDEVASAENFVRHTLFRRSE